MSYTRTLVRGSAIMMLGLILAAAFAYFTRLYLAHSLTVEEFGLFYAVLATVLFLILFRDLGLNQALSRYVAKYQATKKQQLTNSAVLGIAAFQLLISLILVALGWLSADFLAKEYFGNPDAKWLFSILLLYIPLTTFMVIGNSVLRGFKSELLGLQQATKSLLIFGSVILGLHLFGLIGVVYGYLFSVMLTVLFFLFPVLKYLNFLKDGTAQVKKVFREVFIFSIPLIAVTASANVLGLFDTLMLTHFSTLQAVAIYNIVLPTALVLMLISNALGALFMPIITELWEKKKKKLISSSTEILYRYTLIASIPAIFTLLIYAEFFLQVFFGEEFVIGALAFQILLLAILAKLFVALNGQLLSGIAQPKKFMKVMLTGVALNIVLNLILIPKYSLNGAATATAISFFVMALLVFRHVNHLIDLRLFSQQLWKQLLAALAFLVSLYVSKELLQVQVYFDIMFSLAFATVIYIWVLLRTKYFTFDEVKSIIKQSR